MHAPAPPTWRWCWWPSGAGTACGRCSVSECGPGGNRRWQRPRREGAGLGGRLWGPEEPRRQAERSALRGRRALGRCSGRDGRHGTCPLLWRTTSQKRSQTPTRQLQMQGLQHGCPASWFGVWCPFLSRPVPSPSRLCALCKDRRNGFLWRCLLEPRGPISLLRPFGHAVPRMPCIFV